MSFKAADGTAQLEAVSCASASFCVAVDNNGSAVTWNGTTWSSPQTVDSNSGTTSQGTIMNAVSCPSASFCVAVDGNGAFYFNGSSWSTVHALWNGTEDTGTGPPAGVSCVSASFCVAVGTDGGSYTYNGTSWTTEASVDSPDGAATSFTAVSCTTTTFCMGVGQDNNATAIYNGTSWSPFIPVSDVQTLASVSCPSTTFCVAVDGATGVLTWRA
jgi:hypothetical protein